jgi:hypothetical protein
MSTSRCAQVAILAVLLVSLWTAARVHYVFGGNWTAIFYTGSNFRTPPELDAGTYRFPGPGYDGQFYRDLAHDPFLRKDPSQYVDAPQLRFQRLLIPFTAWLLAMGRHDLIDPAYIALEMLFLGLGAYWCARLMVRHGRSPLWGLLFVVVAGVMASLDRMLVDGPLTALFAGFLLYCEEERWTYVWLLALLAALTRETGLLLPAALVADRLLHRDWRRATWFAFAAVPALAWRAWLMFRLPPAGPVDILAVSVWGLVRRLLWFRPYPDLRVQLLLRVTDVLAVIGLAVSIILAIRWLLQSRLGPATLSVAFFAVLALILGAPAHMQDAFGFGRPVSPLLLWVMLEAVYRRIWAALAPPLMVSLSVSLVFAQPFLTICKGLLGATN